MMKTLYININGEKIDSTEDVFVVGRVEDAIINRFYFELGKEVLKGVVSPGISSIKKKDIILDFKVHDESAFNTMMEQWEVFKCQLLGDNPVGEFKVKLPTEYISWLKDSSLPVYAEIAKSLYQRGGVVSISIDKVYTNISNLIVNNIDNGDFACVVVNDNLVTDDSALVMAIQKKYPNITFKPFKEWEKEVETMQSQITEDGKEEKSTDIIAGHRMIDLGLSVCWADCNVGAKFPEDYGDCYAWGETEMKNEYTEDNYLFLELIDNDNIYEPDDYQYCNIGHEISGSKYDVAREKWGDGWRMPTEDEILELIYDCTWILEQTDNIYGRTIRYGYRVVGPSGNSIFLPMGDDGEYWTGTTDYVIEGCDFATILAMNNYNQESRIQIRYYGLAIRPVIDK